MDVTIGCDPEVFVMDAEGKNVSGHGMIPGTKAKPHKVTGGAVQVDGTALELNIEPAENAEQFVSRIRSVMLRLQEMIPDEHAIDVSSTVEYEKEYFTNLPDEAKQLGCDPDFDAYTGLEVKHDGHDSPFRTGAGHVHIGWTKGAEPFNEFHFQSCRTLVKDLDIALGMPSLLFDEDKSRRKMYGQAGSFRPKPYGCEYRVLSNAWLNDEELMKWVFLSSKATFDNLMDKGTSPYYNRVGDSCRNFLSGKEVKPSQIAEYMLFLGLSYPPGYKLKNKPKVYKPKPANTWDFLSHDNV